MNVPIIGQKVYYATFEVLNHKEKKASTLGCIIKGEHPVLWCYRMNNENAPNVGFVLGFWHEITNELTNEELDKVTGNNMRTVQ